MLEAVVDQVVEGLPNLVKENDLTDTPFFPNRSKLWRLRRSGKLPYMKVGGTVVYSKEAIRAFLLASIKREGVDHVVS